VKARCQMVERARLPAWWWGEGIKVFSLSWVNIRGVASAETRDEIAPVSLPADVWSLAAELSLNESSKTQCLVTFLKSSDSN
jgi:hypothetical protein